MLWKSSLDDVEPECRCALGGFRRCGSYKGVSVGNLLYPHVSAAFWRSMLGIVSTVMASSQSTRSTPDIMLFGMPRNLLMRLWSSEWHLQVVRARLLLEPSVHFHGLSARQYGL